MTNPAQNRRRMLTRQLGRLALTVMLLGIGLSAAQARDTVWITGDVRGTYLTSGEESFRPGLARLASRWGGLRRDQGLLVDGGNLFFGHHMLDESLETTLSIPDLLGYDVVHLSYMDLAFGIEPLRQYLPAQSFEVVTGNLFARDGEALAPPFVIRETGNETIAITGLSGLGPPLVDQPAVQRLLEWVEVRDPVAQLELLLPAMRAEADRVLVLYAGDVATLRNLIASLGGEIDLLAVSVTPSGSNEPLPQDAADARGPFGSRVVQWEVRRNRVRQAQIDSSAREDRRVVQALEEAGVPREPAFSEHMPPQQWPEDGLPEDEQIAVRLGGSNRAMGLSVRGLTRSRQWQSQEAPDGYQFLVLDTVAENRKPHDLIAQDNGQTAILFGDLYEALVLLHDDTQVIPLHPDQEDFEDAFPHSFVLSAPRTRARRDFVFLIPEGEPESLVLHHHHIEYDPILIPLTGPENRRTGRRDRRLNLQDNEFLSLGVMSIEEMDSDDPNLRVLAVDLLGRSNLVRENPANHYQRGSDPNDQGQSPRIMRYLHADQHLQLVTAEGHAYLPDWSRSTLPRQPLFLPEHLTGGQLVFAIPETATAYEFVAYFPNMGTATGGLAGYQKPMRFHGSGQTLRYEDYPVLIDFELDTLAVVATAVEVVEEWPGVRAGAGEQVVVVDLAIVNETDEPGFWDMQNRVGLTLGSGSRQTSPALTDRHGIALANPVHLPPGEPRRLRQAFVVPEHASNARIDVRGVNDNPYRELSWQ